jgi:hypothetical protein
MTTYTCPSGHTSSTGDYCDVCGLPIVPGPTGAGAPAAVPQPGAPVAGGPPGAVSAGGGSSLDLDAPLPPPLPGAAGQPTLPGAAGQPTMPMPVDQLCPNCGAPNVPDALYCEDCGYDFTTGQMPRPLEPPPGMPVTPPDTGSVPLTGSGAVPAPSAPEQVSDVAAAPDTGAQDLVHPATSTSPLGPVAWVAEVWIDPDWYAAQDVSDPCPSPGMPWMVPILERSLLVGRVSVSRNIHPRIDISTDSGVSRRHAQLTSDGQRWWVEDLQSANGTYVGAAGAPLPSTPITPGQRVELAEDDRLYLGAWSRVVIRRATPEESSLGS